MKEQISNMKSEMLHFNRTNQNLSKNIIIHFSKNGIIISYYYWISLEPG